MAGLVKPKQYDWKDSNMALFGSDVEKNVKSASAKTEEAWIGAGREVGLQIWRIVKFKVTHWPEEDYGKFYFGDSYIILNTYHPNEKSEELCYDVHFWIGSSSTQDEYATAAYKTVELDIYLDDVPVQHREVQGFESQLFRGYFKKGIILMDGGADSGFRKVERDSHKVRLLRVAGDRKTLVLNEVPIQASSLSSSHVFILDAGHMFFHWNGSSCNKDDRFKALQYMQTLKGQRKYTRAETIEETGTRKTHQFYKTISDNDATTTTNNKSTGQSDSRVCDDVTTAFLTTLYRVSDASGKLTFEKVKEGQVTLEDFDTMDVFILDTGRECFVWVGGGSTPTEKRNGMPYAHNHLLSTDHPLIPVIVVKENQLNREFYGALNVHHV